MAAYPRSEPTIWPYDSVVVANQRKPMSGRILAPERLNRRVSRIIAHVVMTH